MIVTSLVAGVHTPLLTVHLNIELVPGVKPVTPLVALLGVVTVPVPLTFVHTPVAGATAAVAFNVAVLTLHKVCAVPALAVGKASIFTCT